MAFNSGKCISCTEPTKRNAGKYHGKDEKGNYSGSMYICDNISCNINCERRKLLKHVNAYEEINLQEEKRLPKSKENNHYKKLRKKER